MCIVYAGGWEEEYELRWQRRIGCSEPATRNFCATCSHCTNGDTRGDKIHSVGALQERMVRSGTLVLSSWSALVRLQTMRELNDKCHGLR
jgi:hypothetical protein